MLRGIKKSGILEYGMLTFQLAVGSTLNAPLDLSESWLVKIVVCHGQMADWLENEFLDEQVNSIKQISEYITNLKRVGPGLGEYMFDKETLDE